MNICICFIKNLFTSKLCYTSAVSRVSYCRLLPNKKCSLVVYVSVGECISMSWTYRVCVCWVRICFSYGATVRINAMKLLPFHIWWQFRCVVVVVVVVVAVVIVDASENVQKWGTNMRMNFATATTTVAVVLTSCQGQEMQRK